MAATAMETKKQGKCRGKAGQRGSVGRRGREGFVEKVTFEKGLHLSWSLVIPSLVVGIQNKYLLNERINEIKAEFSSMHLKQKN